jgi:hypothetical protein
VKPVIGDIKVFCLFIKNKVYSLELYRVHSFNRVFTVLVFILLMSVSPPSSPSLKIEYFCLGPVYLFPKQLGIDRVPKDEMDGFNYIMYLVGKHLGITDEFNMCRQAVS